MLAATPPLESQPKFNNLLKAFSDVLAGRNTVEGTFEGDRRMIIFRNGFGIHVNIFEDDIQLAVQIDHQGHIVNAFVFDDKANNSAPIFGSPYAVGVKRKPEKLAGVTVQDLLKHLATFKPKRYADRVEDVTQGTRKRVRGF